MKSTCLIISQYDFTSKKGKHIQTGKGIVNFGKYGFMEVTSDKLFGHKVFEEVEVTISVDDYGKILIDKVG